MSNLDIMPVASEVALRWVRESLDQGSMLSARVADRLSDGVEASVISPSGVGTVNIDGSSRGINRREAEVVLERYLSVSRPVHDGVLIVEDDVARAGDPELADVTSIADRIIRWIPTDGEPEKWSTLLRVGASGYPLNAFVCAPPAGDRLAGAGRRLTEADAATLAGCVTAVINSVFDAESFLIASFPP